MELYIACLVAIIFFIALYAVYTQRKTKLIPDYFISQFKSERWPELYLAKYNSKFCLIDIISECTDLVSISETEAVFICRLGVASEPYTVYGYLCFKDVAKGSSEISYVTKNPEIKRKLLKWYKKRSSGKKIHPPKTIMNSIFPSYHIEINAFGSVILSKYELPHLNDLRSFC